MHCSIVCCFSYITHILDCLYKINFNCEITISGKKFDIVYFNKTITSMSINNISETDFRKYVAESKTWGELYDKCGYKKHNGNVKLRIHMLGLDISHLPSGKNGIPGMKKFGMRYSLEEILVENSDYTPMDVLQKRIKSELGWEHRCMRCQLTEWMGQPISLTLRHKNGVRNDHRVSNLEFVCQNCNAQTDTYKKKKRKAEEIDDDLPEPQDPATIPDESLEKFLQEFMS